METGREGAIGIWEGKHAGGVLGLSWLQKWNPYVNWRRGLVKIWHKAAKKGEEFPMPRDKKAKEKREIGAAAQEHPKIKPGIPKKYWDLRDVFNEKGSDTLHPHHPTDCGIEILLGVKLHKPKLYLMTPRELEEFCMFIDKILKCGFIQPDRPRVAAPVLIWKKKDGTLHLYVDYRRLNAVCIENVNPLPLMKDMLAHLAKGKIFAKLDLQDTYYWIQIKEGDEWKIVLNCPLGCFQFQVLPVFAGSPS